MTTTTPVGAVDMDKPTIDTQHFRDLVNVFLDLAASEDDNEAACMAAWKAIVTHIDAKLPAAAPADRNAVLEEAAKAIEHYSLAEQLVRASMANPVMAGVGFTRVAAEAIRELKGKASSEAAAPDLSGLTTYTGNEIELIYTFGGENFYLVDDVQAALSKSPTSLAGSGEKGDSHD